MADVRGVLACPLCKSEELSPMGEYNSFETHARFKGLGGESWRGKARDLMVPAERARVCLDCGHLMLFAAESKVRALRDAIG